MSELVRCRACGFIIDSSSLGEVCPACGVPRSSFEPYTDRVSSSRRWWLNLHVHPVLVHFPQAFAVFLLFAITVGYFGNRFPVLSARFLDTAWILSIFYPFTVLGGLVSGLADGHMRFKRLSAPYLRFKLAAALVFLLVSAAESIIIHTFGIQQGTVWIVIGLNLIAIGCVAVLGKYGESLVCAAMGGK